MAKKNADTPTDDQPVGDLTSQNFTFRTVNSTYNLLARIAKESGTWQVEYQISLRMLATNLYQWASLCRKVEKDGFSYQTVGTNGQPSKKMNPDADHMDRAYKRVKDGLKAHGWDPASSANIEKDNDDARAKLFAAMAEFLAGGELESEFD